MNRNGNHKALDELNRSILEELQQNARLSTAELGRRVGLSPPAVADRIEKMESAGIIKGYHAVLDFDKLDMTVRAFLLFKTNNLNRVEFMKMIESISEIIEWHTITGNYCVLLKIVSPTSARLADIITRLEEKGETNTSLILSSDTKPAAV